MKTWSVERTVQVPLFALQMFIAASCSASSTTFDARDPHSPVHLSRVIALPNVRGRIDHMALDPTSGHLFVAEFANGSLDDVDLTSGTVAGRITGLHDPQGVAWLEKQKEVAVACGDGSVHFYRSSDRHEVARIALGDDADNVRVDPRNGHLIVGYGTGALAIVDPSTHRIMGSLKLRAHPEAFEIIGARVFVNVPNRREVVIGDIDTGAVTRSLGTGTRLGNYPMAAETKGRQVALAFRLPRSLLVIDAISGETQWSTSVCGDADDLFFDAARIIIVCGDGAVELMNARGDRSVHVATRRGARTGLYDATRNRLFIAVPAQDATTASIWELRIQPDVAEPRSSSSKGAH